MSCSEKAQDATVLVQGPDTETQPFDLARSDFSRLVSRGDLNNITSPPIFAGAYSHDAVRDDGAEKGLGLKVRQDPGKSIEGMPCLHVIPIVEHSGVCMPCLGSGRTTLTIRVGCLYPGREWNCSGGS